MGAQNQGNPQNRKKGSGEKFLNNQLLDQKHSDRLSGEFGKVREKITPQPGTAPLTGVRVVEFPSKILWENSEFLSA